METIIHLEPDSIPDNQTSDVAAMETTHTGSASEGNNRPSNLATIDSSNSSPASNPAPHRPTRTLDPPPASLVERAREMVRDIRRSCDELTCITSAARTQITRCRIPSDDDPDHAHRMLMVIETIGSTIDIQRFVVWNIDRLASRIVAFVTSLPPEWIHIRSVVDLDHAVKITMRHCLTVIERLGRDVEHLSSRLRMGHLTRRGPPFVRE